MPWCNGIRTGYVHMCWSSFKVQWALGQIRKHWDAGDLAVNMAMVETSKIDDHVTHVLTCFLQVAGRRPDTAFKDAHSLRSS